MDPCTEWLSKKSHRWLDLITELGAENLFFVSGDSLVLEYLTDSHLSWCFDTPVLLHLVYAIGMSIFYF